MITSNLIFFKTLTWLMSWYARGVQFFHAEFVKTTGIIFGIMSQKKLIALIFAHLKGQTANAKDADCLELSYNSLLEAFGMTEAEAQSFGFDSTSLEVNLSPSFLDSASSGAPVSSCTCKTCSHMQNFSISNCSRLISPCSIRR